ncbi:hypothetical protein [Streptomyces sp. NPDC048669]|uniref:hypothetical protein n=1 Tax=Streptomyces sp. NPDC048669 TaxID=3155267 RepID=UPI00344A3435
MTRCAVATGVMTRCAVVTGVRPGCRPQWRTPPRLSRPEVLELALWAAGGDPRLAVSGRGGQSLTAGPRPGAVAGAGDEALTRARCAVRAARERQRLGRHAEAAALADTALLWARRAGSEPERATALSVLGVSLWHGPEPVSAAVLRLRGLLEEHGEKRPAARLALAVPLAVLHGMQERWTLARAALDLVRSVAVESDPASGGVLVSVLTARVESLAGRTLPAVRLLRAAADAADAHGLGLLRDAVRWAAVRLLTDTDRYEEAARWLPRGCPPPSRTVGGGGAAWTVGEVRPAGLAARIAAAQGRTGEARTLAERAVGEAAATDSPLAQALARLDQAEVLRLTGCRDEARHAVSLAGWGFARKGHVPGVSDATVRHAALASVVRSG